MERVLAALGATSDPSAACASLLRASAHYPVGAAARGLRAASPAFDARLRGQRARLVGLLRALVGKVEPGGGVAAACDPHHE